jgi:serine/threonine protein kinase
MLNTPEHEATGSRGSARWMSPELVRFVNKSATVKSDVWAFAMMILEASNRLPHFKIDTYEIVINRSTPDRFHFIICKQMLQLS